MLLRICSHRLRLNLVHRRIEQHRECKMQYEDLVLCFIFIQTALGVKGSGGLSSALDKTFFGYAWYGKFGWKMWRIYNYEAESSSNYKSWRVPSVEDRYLKKFILNRYLKIGCKPHFSNQ